MFVFGKSRTVFFPSDTLIYSISQDGSKNFNIRICEHMILGQLSMGARQTKNAPLLIYMWSQGNGFPHVWVIYFRLCVIYVQAGCFVWCAKRASAVYWHLWYWVSTINWIGRKGHLQFIGFLGHYFTPAYNNIYHRKQPVLPVEDEKEDWSHEQPGQLSLQTASWVSNPVFIYWIWKVR